MVSISARRSIVLFAISLSLATVFLCGCKKSEDNEGALRVAILSSPTSLDPRLAVDAEGSKITSLIFDGLFMLDDQMNLVSALAERYEVLSDTLYRFYLRRDVKFHSGAKLTSKDVLFTYKSILDPKTRSPYKAAFDRVKSMRALGDYAVEIELKEPYSPFLTALKVKIVSEADVLRLQEKYASSPVGTGRYLLKEFVPETKIVLEANPNYWGAIPKQKRLVFRVIKEDNVRVLKLMKGDVDLVQNGVPPLLVEKLKKREDLKLLEDIGIVSTYIGLNLTDPILGKRNVRQAIALAINVNEIIRWRWRGLATRANSILAPSLWAYNNELKPISYDPETAKKLLDEAGFPDPDGDGPKMRFEIEYKTTTAKDRIDIARMIIHQLNQVGIGVLLRTYEWGTFFKDVRTGNFQMYSLSWVGVTEPDILYNICHSSQMPPVGLNRDRYSNPEVDRLVELGRLKMNIDERKRIYDKLQVILLKDLPFIPLWYEKNWVMYRAGLRNVSLRPDASYLPFADIVLGEREKNK